MQGNILQEPPVVPCNHKFMKSCVRKQCFSIRQTGIVIMSCEQGIPIRPVLIHVGGGEMQKYDS